MAKQKTAVMKQRIRLTERPATSWPKRQKPNVASGKWSQAMRDVYNKLLANAKVGQVYTIKSILRKTGIRQREMMQIMESLYSHGFKVYWSQSQSGNQLVFTRK